MARSRGCSDATRTQGTGRLPQRTQGQTWRHARQDAGAAGERAPPLIFRGRIKLWPALTRMPMGLTRPSLGKSTMQVNFDLSGRVALVTGSSRGIGWAV